jgi:hypothetical protein
VNIVTDAWGHIRAINTPDQAVVTITNNSTDKLSTSIVGGDLEIEVITESIGPTSGSGLVTAGSIYSYVLNNTVNSINGITGAIGITSGTNVSVVRSGNTFTISSSSSSGVSEAFVIAMSIAL